MPIDTEYLAARAANRKGKSLYGLLTAINYARDGQRVLLKFPDGNDLMLMRLDKPDDTLHDASRHCDLQAIYRHLQVEDQ